jgi:hypothetical protein
MQTAADFGQERRELEAVLASGIFNRAPNLAHVLNYVCAKYFEGAAEQIKEYNIAVEALGRHADFDQKRDSIVRVEAHRLRKRLREYYETGGAGHAVRIEIPSGQYAPKFLPQPPPEAGPVEETLVAPAQPIPKGAVVPQAETSTALAVSPSLSAPANAAPIAKPAKRPTMHYAIPMALILATACAGGFVFWRVSAKPATKTAAVAANPGLPVAPLNSQEIRILAGHTNGAYIDRFGRAWQSDRYFQGGTVYESGNRPISGTRDPTLYQSRREGTFSYDIPLPPGAYELRLHFAETLYGENNVAGGGETSRLFDLYINSVEAMRQFDVIGDVGSSAADIRAFKDISPAADGKLHLKFEPYSNPAFLNAIEIIPGTPGKLRPIRMVSRDHAFTDKQGRVWEPDRYSHGGQLVLRTEPVENTDDPDLFHGERYGNLKYIIPVPKGRYTVTLYFAEVWFGPGTPAGGGAGSRIFDILCNGVALKRNFDIYKEAKGSGRAFTQTTRGLEPDAQGKLTVSLVPVRNYASLNAIEVIDESK